MDDKRVCVVGAGASGLVAVKSCLEAGLSVLCYEKSPDIGGLWRFKPHVTPEEASVMKSTVINTSKELMAFSDFPPPSNAPNYMHNRDVLAYFRAYADYFDLLPHLRFGHRVRSVHRHPQGKGRWLVTVADEKGEEVKETFDAVLVCSGHHVDPYIPDIPGIQHFKGKLMHSQEYKDSPAFEGKTVAVLGIGNSAVDIAVDVSRSAAKVFVCTRRGAWLQWKVGPGGLPADMGKTRALTTAKSLFPGYYAAKAQQAVNDRVNLGAYGLTPSCGIGEAHPTESDELPIRILSGAVQIRHSIASVNESGVLVLGDGSELAVDVVVFCTGYSFSFPFIEDGKLIPVSDNTVSLYKYMYPPELPDPTLAIIGLVQPLGSTIPVAEIQSRLACQVLLGNVELPDKDRMLRDIASKREAMAARYVPSRRHTIQVDFIGYMDEIASMFGARPSWRSALLSDPTLAYAILFYPCAPYQYRLRGPFPWDGARDALVDMWERIRAPTATRPQLHSDPSTNFTPVVMGVGVAIGAFVLWQYRETIAGVVYGATYGASYGASWMPTFLRYSEMGDDVADMANVFAETDDNLIEGFTGLQGS